MQLAFGMTIEKSQGQSLDKIGIYLSNKIFNHGQCYVAFSRVSAFSDVKVFDEMKEIEERTKCDNIVYKELLLQVYEGEEAKDVIRLLFSHT